MLAAFLRALFFYILSLPCCAETIFLPFYRHRAARKQYLCHFIVTARRGNNIFAILSSSCSAGTIFSRFIVVVQRGNNICAILSSPCSAGTIFVPFYRHRAARERYFCHFIVCSVTASIKIFVFISAEWRHVLEW